MIQGQVQVLGEIGRGGLGELFKCRDERGQVFAVKFPRRNSDSSQQLLLDEERRLARHQGKNVVRYLGRVVRPDGAIGVAIELMEGDLAGLIRFRGHLTPLQTLTRLRPVVHAIAGVHGSGWGAFHGDLKTANLLLQGATTKLADFGLARGGAGQTIMFGPHQGGTPGYMPPEAAASAEGDIYSLGVVFCVCLTGREPVSGQNLRTVDIPDHPLFAAMVNQMLDPNPHARPTARDVAAKLDELEREAQAIETRSNASSAIKVALGALGIFGLIALLTSK